MDGQELVADAGGLDAAFQESFTELGGELEAAESAPDPEVEPDASPVEEEESFTDTDPADLPESQRKIYKQLQRDYTKKTQALAAQRKDLEAKKARLEAWTPAMDQYDRDPEVRARVNAAFAKAEAAAEKAGATSPDKFEAFLSKYDEPSKQLIRELKAHMGEQSDGSTKDELARQKAELDKVNSQIEATQRSLNEREAANQQKRFEKAHPTWKEDTTPRQKKLFMAELWENPTADPAEIYESIMAEFDKGATVKADKTVRTLVNKAGNRPLRTPGTTARGSETIVDMKDAFLSSMREAGR